MSHASAVDVTDRLGRDVSDDTALLTLITTRLADVERLILRRIPDLEAQITAATINVADVIQVEAEAVLRLARNPNGYISETDGSYTYEIAQNISSGTLEVLPGEWEILGVCQPAVTVLVPRVRVLPPWARRPLGWGWGWRDWDLDEDWR
jgi:hypothetical protein